MTSCDPERVVEAVKRGAKLALEDAARTLMVSVQDIADDEITEDRIDDVEASIEIWSASLDVYRKHFPSPGVP